MARVSVPPPSSFAERVVAWQRVHGRHGLPWQGTRDAYRIWISEVMLQQTQVHVVLGYYARFLERFPTVASLAAAPLDEVLALWSGLGYYARARNLHRAARDVVERHGGIFPESFEALASLPGIGRSTAGAIAAFATGERRPILDGNVRRVLARHAGIAGDPSSKGTLDRLWSAAEERLAEDAIEAYTQGMMDLGAEICAPRRPACLVCPVAGDCIARVEGRIEELPGRRAVRERPRRRTAMLALTSGRSLLLEQRAARGVWGGLWSLPEFDAGASAEELLRTRFGWNAARCEALAPIEHAFSHFTLEIVPFRLELATRRRPPVSSPHAWHARGSLARLGLPAPIRRLIEREALAQ